MGAVQDLTISQRPRSPLKRAQLFLDAIKFQESLFALPFAYTGMLLAASGLPSWDKVFWITAAMVGARTFGMSANRILDRSIDALNPRTAGRHLPAGLLNVTDVGLPAAAALALLFISAWQLNPLALALGARGRRLPRSLPVHQEVHVGGKPAARLGVGNSAVRGVDRGHGQPGLSLPSSCR